MKKKVFGIFLFLILTLSASTIAFASDFEELVDSAIYIHDLAERNASEFDRMGINVFTEYTVSSLAVAAQQTRRAVPYDVIENPAETCRCCGNLLVINLSNPNIEVLHMPSVTRASQDVEVQISETDVDILVDFVASTLGRGIPIHFSSCFYLALREQGVYELFIGKLDSWNAERRHDIDSIQPLSQATIMPTSTFHFSANIASGNVAHDTRSQLHSHHRVLYNFTLNGSSTVTTSLLCQMTWQTWTSFPPRVNVSSGEGLLFVPHVRNNSIHFGLANLGSFSIHASMTFSVF
jgi:hypothetical protein